MARPTSYDPSYCEKAIEFLCEGYSVGALAGEIGVCRATIFNWMNEHPEFLDAVKRGQARSQLWWERRNMAFAESGEGNATAIVFGLKNRARDDWQDITRNEHSGPDGEPIRTVTGVEWTVVNPEA